MATPQTSPETSLRRERSIAAPREAVFAAWTRPETIARWFAPTDDYTVVVTDLDLRPGGRWRLEMRHKGGAVHPVGGVYRAVDAPSRLSFTWAWEDDTAPGESLVTVELADDGPRTRLTLTHTLFPNADVRDRHTQGWNGCLPRLERLF